MTARTSTRTTLSALLLTGALALSACSTDDSNAGFTEGDDATEQAAVTEETTDDAAPDEGTDANASDGENNENSNNSVPNTQITADDAVETVTYDIPNDDIDGTITVGFHSLKVRGETMELTLTYTPEFEGGNSYNLWQLHSSDHSAVAPALFDRENLKRYDILRAGPEWESGDVWNSSHLVTRLNSGDTQVYQATFAAPQDDIDTINVAVSAAPEFEDVQIEREGESSGSSSESASTEETTEEEN
ncbi:hypothetical protein [Citricoccus muralis]|uniref:DUF5067 domain-containing protein n=1 Tax=Citricoccus muralis TaxID=169134 RepID=A0ABY8H8P0_9MICC|nr:hypothetical protein [Citricoccus muralis]WFP17514.1 hypothetical protein P8192_05240 [Citricoccus muralis]